MRMKTMRRMKIEFDASTRGSPHGRMAGGDMSLPGGTPVPSDPWGTMGRHTASV